MMQQVKGAESTRIRSELWEHVEFFSVEVLHNQQQFPSMSCSRVHRYPSPV